MRKEQRIAAARRCLPELGRLQRLGLICSDGDFVPSVHYPPITQYPASTPDEIYKGYTQPEDGRLDVYVHFPFCARRCLFCHYPGKLGPQVEEKTRYIGALQREIDLYRERFSIPRIRPRSILIGGGTPTYLPPGQLSDFLDFLCDRVDVKGCAQFNYDVDPDTLLGDDGAQRLTIMREHGVTRLTIGLQSLDDGVLRCMNRGHDADTAVRSVHAARDAGFDLNIEFIYGHPGETLENWIEVMEKAVTLPTDEIQLYRLKVLAYGDRQGDILYRRDAVPSFEETMTMKQLAIDILEENGYLENLRRVYTRDRRHISHYAFNQCCNLYDQVGFGITAFSSYRDRFALNTASFDAYYGAIQSGTLPHDRGYIRDREQQLRWSIVLPLKNMEVRKAQFERQNGLPLSSAFTAKFAALFREGLLTDTGRSVRLTALGSFVADEVAEQFNDNAFMPFAPERYADGPLHPYRNNTARDAFGLRGGEVSA